MSKVDTAAIIRGLDPADWVQIKLLANLPPEKRIIPAMRAQAFAMSTFRLTLEKRYPKLSREEISLKLLEHFTTVRMPKK
jgi:hypothetical protein